MKINRELLKIIFFIIFVNIKTDVFAITKNKIIASVDNQIVSSYELKNKVRTILFLANQSINQANINLVKQKALQQLIDYKLKTRVNPFQFVDSEVLTVDSLSTSSCESLVSRFKNGIYIT